MKILSKSLLVCLLVLFFVWLIMLIKQKYTHLPLEMSIQFSDIVGTWQVTNESLNELVKQGYTQHLSAEEQKIGFNSNKVG